MMLTAMDCFYVSEVLNIYRQAASNCYDYDSVDDATSASSLSYLSFDSVPSTSSSNSE